MWRRLSSAFFEMCTCLGMRTVRSNLSSTILWKRDSSVRDLGKQGAHFKAEIAVEMENFF